MNGDQCSSTHTQVKSMDKQKEIDRKKAIYKNVLTFPQGVDHLKYFEKNPHPERIPDELLAFSELFAKPDLNVNPIQQSIEFNLIKKYLEPNLSDRDRKIMRMPDILQQIIDASTDRDAIKAMTHLRSCFYNYFSTPLSEHIRPDIQWIEYHFVSKYRPTQVALNKLKNNLFNAKAMDKLVEKLHEAGAFADKRKDFYFWNTSPYNWSEISYQSRSVTWLSWPSFREFIKFKIRPQYLALGDFTINAIPEGYIQPKDNGKYDICVNKMYFFINDVFNFENFEYLGHWDLNQGYENSYLENYTDRFALYNSDFREYRRHGYGRYFPVLSKLHQVEDFEPVCKEYSFAK